MVGEDKMEEEEEKRGRTRIIHEKTLLCLRMTVDLSKISICYRLHVEDHIFSHLVFPHSAEVFCIDNLLTH